MSLSRVRVGTRLRHVAADTVDALRALLPASATDSASFPRFARTPHAVLLLGCAPRLICPT